MGHNRYVGAVLGHSLVVKVADFKLPQPSADFIHARTQAGTHTHTYTFTECVRDFPVKCQIFRITLKCQ